MRAFFKHLFISSIVAAFAFTSCRPLVSVQKAVKGTTPLAAETPVDVLYPEEVEPTQGQLLGKIKIADNGLSVNCGFLEVLEIARNKARAMGGNTLYITSHRLPDYLSTCHRIEARVYKVAEPYLTQRKDMLSDDDTSASSEILPEYPGGFREMAIFISQNMHYPKTAAKDYIEGKVTVSFIVSKTGSISDITIAEGVREDLDQEAVRLIALMPEWIPGFQDGKAVPVRFTMPLHFSLLQSFPFLKRPRE